MPTPTGVSCPHILFISNLNRFIANRSVDPFAATLCTFHFWLLFGYFLVTFWLLLSLLFLAFSLTLCNSNRGHFNSHFCFNFQRCFETFASARPRDNAGDGAGNSSSRSPFPAPSVIPFSLLYPSSGFTLLLLILFLALDKCFSGI